MTNHALVLFKEVHGAQQRPVAHLAAQGRQRLIELLRAHTAQVRFIEQCRHFLHFRRNRRVIVCQISVIAARRHHDQRITVLGEVKVHRAHIGVIMLEVHRHQTASRRRHLIKQTAGLAEIHVFGVLADFRARLVVDGEAVVERVKNGARHHLERRRAAQAAAGHDIRRHRRVEAADFVAQFRHPRRHAAHQRMGFPLLLFNDIKAAQIHLDGRIAVGVDFHHHIVARGNRRKRIQVDCRRQHTPAVVVGVVAANFRAAGGADHQHFAVLVKQLFMPFEQTNIASRLLHQHTVAAAIQVHQAFHHLRRF